MGDVSRTLRERMRGLGSSLLLLTASMLVITGYLALTALVFLPLLGVRSFSRTGGDAANLGRTATLPRAPLGVTASRRAATRARQAHGST